MFKTDPAPRPEALPVPVVDTHTHVDLVDAGFPADAAVIAEPTSPQITSWIDEAATAGVEHIVQVGTDVESSRWAADLADHDRRVLAAAALHPNDAPIMNDVYQALNDIDQLAYRDRVAALGETGLDYFRTGPEGRYLQRMSFRAHIEMAKRHNKTLVIHDREAHDDCLAILDDEGAPDRVIFHCFSGDYTFAEECAKRGFHMSFAGNVTFKNAGELRKALTYVPAELMLVETDAPFMAPMPVRGHRNEPALTAYTVRHIAHFLNKDLSKLCFQLDQNSRHAFGTW
ncbi:TatD family hydrolase [Haloglycomyces albus]|uniref:TatD family hydrolase n=1 Tax=Haloglycomyces albus TaxID=526067 RepID=UPI00046CD4EA|nr:TatD family hydrolase [Haloglycomyces albus]